MNLAGHEREGRRGCPACCRQSTALTMTVPAPAYPPEVHDPNVSLRRRINSSNGVQHAGDGPPSPVSSTTKKAREWQPGTIRVRFSALKDILYVMRLRYMASLFHLSSVIMVVQLAMWAYAKPEVVKHIPQETVGDACAQLYAELRGLAPVFFVVVGSFLMRRDKSVYLLDFALFDPPEEWRTSRDGIMSMLKNLSSVRMQEGLPAHGETELEFMHKVLGNSGTGEATAWPPGIIKCCEPGTAQDQSMIAARKEAETVICSCLDDLFKRTGIQPKEVDFLIINCSLFSPTPSLCAMACNRFQMRSGVKTCASTARSAAPLRLPSPSATLPPKSTTPTRLPAPPRPLGRLTGRLRHPAALAPRET